MTAIAGTRRSMKELIGSILSYDKETGLFTWMVSPRRGIAPGSVAGTVNLNGYRIICIDGKKYRASRLAWFCAHGVWPNGEIDHRDRNRLNDAIANLREATSSQQKANRSANNGRELPKGVKRRYHKFVARLGKKHIGSFGTVEEARMAYLNAAREEFGEFSV